MNNSIITVPFHEQSLLATIVDGIPHVAMKPICENIGIDWSAQAQKIKRHPVLSKGMVIITTPSKGGIQEMLTLPLRMLNGWLFLIDSSRVKPEAKNKVLEYQEECFEVLANHFMPKQDSAPELSEHLPAKIQHIKDTVLGRAKQNDRSYGSDYNNLFTAIGIDKLCSFRDRHYPLACDHLSIEPKVFVGEMMPKAQLPQQENFLTVPVGKDLAALKGVTFDFDTDDQSFFRWFISKTGGIVNIQPLGQEDLCMSFDDWIQYATDERGYVVVKSSDVVSKLKAKGGK